ncbi:MAG: hypothetical protein PHZ16_01585 [Eubacteriales bacterium]|nr:hypothetical protein [Eubacteriales bacterium]
MISKLYRLEMNENWRVARIVYPLMIFITAGAALLSLLNNPAIRGISMFINILTLVFGSIYVIVQTVYNDYHNFQGKRGYLFRSIPAKSSEFLLSRFFYYLSFFLATLIIFTLLFLTVLEVNLEAGVFNIVWIFLSELVFTSGWGIAVSAYILISMLISIIVLIFVITVGSEAKLHRLGAGGPVLVYFIYYLVGQVLTLLSMVFIPLGIRMTVNPLNNSIVNVELVTEGMLKYFLDSLRLTAEPEQVVIGIGFIFTQILLAVVIAFLTYRSFDKKFSLRA